VLKKKKKRGGQRGNQNARKHGFYSGTFDAEQLSQFWNLVAVEKQPPEIAALGVKLGAALHANPGNRRIIRDAARLSAEWISKREQLNREETEYARKCYLELFQAHLGLRCSGLLPELDSNKWL
jgi:hypothetical protein